MCVFLAWSVISLSILESQPSITVVFLAFPMDAGRESPSLSYYSFPLSSELRKHWLAALPRDEGANSRVSESTVLCSGRFLRKIFTFLPLPKSLYTPITDHGKARKAGRFLKVGAVPSVFFFFFFFFFKPTSLRAPVSNGMSVDYQAEKGIGPDHERKRAVDTRWPNDETTLYRQLAEHERLQRKRSKVREGSADRAANTRCWPTRSTSVHSDFRDIFKQDCRKSKAIVLGLRSCRWEIWGKTSRRGREEKEIKGKKKNKKKKNSKQRRIRGDDVGGESRSRSSAFFPVSGTWPLFFSQVLV